MKFKKRLFSKIFLIFSVSLLVIAVAVGWYGTHALRKEHIEQVELFLKKHLLQLERSFADTPWAKKRPDRFCKTYGKLLSFRVTFIQKDGSVLGDSDADPRKMDNHSERPEIISAKNQPFGLSSRFSDTVKKEMLYVAKQIEGIGYLRVALPLKTLRENFSGFSHILFILFLMGGILILFVGLKTTQLITKPVEEMTAFSKKIAEGDFSQKLFISRADELGILAGSLNSMKDQLSQTISNISQEKLKLSTILSSIYDGVLAIDIHKSLILYNQRFLDIFHIQEKELQGRRLLEVVRVPELSTLIDTSLADHKICQKQIKIVSHSEEKHYEVIVSPFFLKGEEIFGIVSIFHDITGLKRVEQMRADFVANVSHEFKTPLTSIRGYTDTLLQGGLDDRENSGKFVTIIKNNVDRLTALVDDLLTLSELESSEPLRARKFDFCVFADHIISKMKPAAEKKNISLEMKIKIDELTADETKLEQALLNLLDNAVKYTPSDGKIQIEAEKTTKEIKLTVKDTGIGISSEHLPRIFERFYCVDRGRDRELGGTGLGLAIVKHVALLHEGTVDVESSPGKGSSFILKFPLR